jgi:hypothetical protein
MMALEQAQQELLKHSWDNFVLHPPSIAEGGRGVVVVGCPGCQKPMQTPNQFMRHLAEDVLPVIFSYEREPGEEG